MGFSMKSTSAVIWSCLLPRLRAPRRPAGGAAARPRPRARAARATARRRRRAATRTTCARSSAAPSARARRRFRTRSTHSPPVLVALPRKARATHAPRLSLARPASRSRLTPDPRRSSGAARPLCLPGVFHEIRIPRGRHRVRARRIAGRPRPAAARRHVPHVKKVETLTVTASPLSASEETMAQPVQVITGEELRRKRAPSLGDTLGAGAGRAVERLRSRRGPADHPRLRRRARAGAGERHRHARRLHHQPRPRGDRSSRCARARSRSCAGPRPCSTAAARSAAW